MGKIGEPYEIIFVNDCSTDGSLDKLKSIPFSSPNLTVITLKKRYGQSVAMRAGLNIARGELIITMDGDLQNDPKDIPKLLEKMEEGCEIVCGWRYNRKDSWGKVSISKIICAIRRIITKENVHDFGCSLRVFKKDLLEHIYFSKSLHILLPLIMFKLGFKIGEVKVIHYPRRFGTSKYNVFDRLILIRDFIHIMLFPIFNLKESVMNYEIHRSVQKINTPLY